MNLNYDRGRNIEREFQQEFRGINHKIRPSETEFASAKNLSAAEYPALTTRRERNYITDIGRCEFPSLCALGDGNIAYISIRDNAHHICINNDIVYTFEGEAPDIPHKMVRMGSYLCVFPDGIVYNVKDNTVKKIHSEISSKNVGAINIYPSKLDGKIAAISDAEPANASVGDAWYNSKENKTYLCSGLYTGWEQQEAMFYANSMDLAMSTNKPPYAVQFTSFSGGLPQEDTGTLSVYNGDAYIATGAVSVYTTLPDASEDGSFVVLSDTQARRNYLYLYRTNKPLWTEFPTSYSKIFTDSSESDISEYFSVGDVIEVGEYGYVRVYTAVSAQDDSDGRGYIVTDGIEAIGAHGFGDFPFTITRKMPENMTNIIECSNRLWATDSEGREIYASKLGDPFNWYAFSGLASDSYAITVGSGGKFTGAVSYDGYPHFFKETSITKIYGSYPFRVFSLDCPGVAAGNEKSVAVLNGVLIYKSINGFYAYDGGFPSLISESISDISGSDYVVSASVCDEYGYYAAVENEIYSFEKGFWHIHDAPDGGVLDMCNTGHGIIAAFSANDALEDGTYATGYLVMLSGTPPSGMGSKGAIRLECRFDVTLAYLTDYTEADYVLTLPSAVVSKINVGALLIINDQAYSVKNIIKTEDENYYLDVGVIDVGVITPGAVHSAYIYSGASVRWEFTSARYGLSLPDDKWYSKFVFRYSAENTVEGCIIYDDEEMDEFELPPKGKSTIGSFAITLSPRKTEYMRIKLSGEGEFVLLSICKNIEGGNTP